MSGKRRRLRSISDSHADAVLDLSWNKPNKHILASCSADRTAKVWDLNKARCVYSLSHHSDKVQCVEWSPVEPTMLLTGSYDRTTCLLDSRRPSATLAWQFLTDVECLKWNPHRPEQFVVSCEDGKYYCLDARSPGQHLYSVDAHTGPACSLAFSYFIPGCLVTSGVDMCVKGPVYAVGFSPDSPFIIAAGGQKGKLTTWNLADHSAVVSQFKERAKSYYE
ncbi:hypothetical protein Zmor_012308 [Zophobas morio]|uniref:WD repeat-containing protein 55 homolog n=1 Tax=Zophobas morio TaxID=2755281 RepID=A0AA38LY14_9CUCU|nr:hypothetical protein Zmor_012308 [Zophobas morio]